MKTSTAISRKTTLPPPPRLSTGSSPKPSYLTTFPDIGTRLRIVPEGEVRMILYGHYRIAYLHWKEVELVEVLGVFHGALDIDRYFP